MTNKKPLHDYRNSRAVLIGTSDYEYLPVIPAAANSLKRMTNTLTSDLCGWPLDRVSVFGNERKPGDLPDRLIRLFEEVMDVALFYFVGHGQVDLEDQLCLGLAGSRRESSQRATTSLQFHSVRRAMLNSPATTKILILDCCFAAPANKPSNALGTSADLLDKATVTGAYTMAASSATAWFETRPKKSAQTYFTKYLSDLVANGIPGEPEALRIRALFRRVQENLARDHRPVPADRNIDAAGDYLFAHNAAQPATPPGEATGTSADTELELRTQLRMLREMLTNLTRRSQSLVERQIRLIDELERGEQDPDRLASLFQMDHLATLMRRNTENLLVLAGHESVGGWDQPVPLVDVLRAAISEIEQYERVVLNVQPGIAVRGPAVNDVVHLIAELAENATSFSSAGTPVSVSGHLLSSGGVMLDITDHGVGMGSEEMAHVNWQLDHPTVVDVAVSRRMGLFVVASLAARNNIRVRLRSATPFGLTALVWLPEETISHDSGQ